MFADRYVEMLNKVQDERRGSFAAFDKAIEFTPALVGLLHALHGQEILKTGVPQACDSCSTSYLLHNIYYLLLTAYLLRRPATHCVSLL